MIEYRPADERFRTDSEGRTTWHSFSFGAHYDPKNVGFDALVAHNDENLPPGSRLSRRSALSVSRRCAVAESPRSLRAVLFRDRAPAKLNLILQVGPPQADGLHPLGVAQEYARKLPNAELVVEDKGDSPLAWQGARLSNAIADFFERVGYAS